MTALKNINSTEEEMLNSVLYFNPNCTLQLILDYICAEAHISVDGKYLKYVNSKSLRLYLR